MKLKDEDLKKVSGGRAPECREPNFDKEIPSESLSNHIFNLIYVVDKTNNKNWILGFMDGKWHNAPKFDMKVCETSTGDTLTIGGVTVKPGYKDYTLPIDACKFYEYH